MKLPKRIAEILAKKQEYIDLQRGKLEESVVKLQSKLLDDIVTSLIPELDIKDGIIQDTPKNYRLISVLDKTFKDFQTVSTSIMSTQIIKSTSQIAELSKDFFSISLSGNLPARFDKIVSTTDKLINLKIGLDGGKMTRGGFLQSFFDSNTIGTDLKQMTSKAVTSNLDKDIYVKQLRDMIEGVPKTVVKDGIKTTVQTGALERQYQRYAYDLYQQYDAAYNLVLGNEFGFNYFIYQGGLVKDSREFCVEHNNKVYSKDEALTWGEWKSPTTGETPSYLGWPGYDPLIDRGGFNCRHSLGWIADDLAFAMRPDLKEEV